MASTHVIPLPGAINVSGKIETPSKQSATCLRITKTSIVISASDIVEIELTYGNMVNGDFVPITTNNAAFVVKLNQSEITALSNTPLSPTERQLSPFAIVNYRLGAYLKAKLPQLLS